MKNNRIFCLSPSETYVNKNQSNFEHYDHKKINLENSSPNFLRIRKLYKIDNISKTKNRKIDFSLFHNIAQHFGQKKSALFEGGESACR